MSDIVETIEECNRYARNKGDLLSIKGFCILIILLPLRLI